MPYLADILVELVEWLDSPECGPKEGEDWAARVRLYLDDFGKRESDEDAAYARGYAAGGHAAFQRIDGLIKAEFEAIRAVQDASRTTPAWLTKI